ncbi:hypothetical protein FHG87_014339 [Trinorchestia longiramus]|nr:hypothetical protein FHG87_014339 [Trinorchestia longiramus]
MANLTKLLDNVNTENNIAVAVFVILVCIAVLLYIIYNSSLLPPIDRYPFGQPVFRSSKDRRKARLRDVRASKCSSGDSGDSGIEITGSGAISYSELVSEGPASSVFHATACVVTRLWPGAHCLELAFLYSLNTHQVKHPEKVGNCETVEDRSFCQCRGVVDVPPRGEGCGGAFTGGSALHDVMAWVVDVSRCLGLVEIKGCSAARLVPSTEHVRESGPDKVAAAHDGPPITNDVTSIASTDGCAGEVMNPSQVPVDALTNSGSSSASSVEEMDSQDERENLLLAKDAQNNLNRFESVSTPCLLDIARLKVLCSPNKRENSKSSKRSCSTVDHSCSSSASSQIGFCDSKNLLTQSYEVLSPSPSSKLLGKLRFATACSRRVILSKGDCTVQYSPMTAPASVHMASGCKSSEADLCNTPRSSIRKYSSVASPDTAGRSALMDRVCGVGNDVQPGVPPMPATEHPTRPPRIDLCCSQHLESTSLSDRTQNNQSALNCLSRRSRGKETTSRRAVKSASGLPQDSFSTAVRSWSEYWLGSNSTDSSEIISKFQENRTSSLRGPPSRATSACLLLNSLDLSDVSLA